MNLTDEEIRIKVAEAMEWTHVQPTRYHGIKIIGVPPNARESDLNFPTSDPDIWCALVPNYPLDLNACAEFEKTLSSSECAAYRDFLHKNPMCYDDMIGACIDWQLIHATARQRCLAYLKVKGILP